MPEGHREGGSLEGQVRQMPLKDFHPRPIRLPHEVRPEKVFHQCVHQAPGDLTLKPRPGGALRLKGRREISGQATQGGVRLHPDLLGDVPAQRAQRGLMDPPLLEPGRKPPQDRIGKPRLMLRERNQTVLEFLRQVAHGSQVGRELRAAA